MRWWIAGASGLVGAHVVEAARAAGVHVDGSARNIRGDATRVVELTSHSEVKAAVTSIEPQAVVICSAWPYVDGCERDPAKSERENVDTVRNVIASTANSGAKLVFFSTDHVFDGTRAPNREDDPVNPLSVYAKHKRISEELLLDTGRALIIRTSYVFGAEPARKNFVYRVIDAALTGKPLEVPRAQGGTPTWAGWLAKTTVELMQNGTLGIAHLVGPQVMSKADWARTIATGLGLAPMVEVREVEWAAAGQVAPRPAQVQLITVRHVHPHPDLGAVLAVEARAIRSHPSEPAPAAAR